MAWNYHGVKGVYKKQICTIVSYLDMLLHQMIDLLVPQEPKWLPWFLWFEHAGYSYIPSWHDSRLCFSFLCYQSYFRSSEFVSEHNTLNIFLFLQWSVNRSLWMYCMHIRVFIELYFYIFVFVYCFYHFTGCCMCYSAAFCNLFFKVL